MTIAVCNSNLHGDTLWSVPAARELATRHGCQADFWVTWRAGMLKDLLEAQPFVRHVFVEDESLYTGGGLWGNSDDGWMVTPTYPLKATDPKYDYESVYELHMRSQGGASILDWFCRSVGLPRQGHWFDLPSGVPRCELPRERYVVLAAKPWEETPWMNAINQTFRHFVSLCRAPVVEVGPRRHGVRCVADDLGSIDRTSEGFLEMAGVISQCKVFVGTPSAPLVLADAFPDVWRVCLHSGPSFNRDAVTKSPVNHYLDNPSPRQLLEMVEWMLKS